ncbi:MAG: hypothetical protein QOG64_2051, partial [Acidimicrobiaceae bacterium]|nr:hypothetical protein [Acidimicrobiaceae bacterium]
FMDRALYGTEGFYQRGGQAGRRGDFITSPELGPLFAAVVADAIGAGPVVEVGGGAGTLARDILAVKPELTYTVVERSVPLRAAAEERAPGATVVERMPPGRLGGVVLANELLDNLAFDVLEWRAAAGWLELGVDEHGEEAFRAAADDDIALANRLVPDPPEGSRIPVQRQATQWVAGVLERLDHGRLIVIDYADTTPAMARRPWRDWLRTYKSHGRGSHPLAEPGSQDITVEVAVDQLPPPTRNRTQAAFLREHGVEALVDEARRTWTERAAKGDLVALKARSRINEAAALLDPAGLGGFRVLEWET